MEKGRHSTELAYIARRHSSRNPSSARGSATHQGSEYGKPIFFARVFLPLETFAAQGQRRSPCVGWHAGGWMPFTKAGSSRGIMLRERSSPAKLGRISWFLSQIICRTDLSWLLRPVGPPRF